MSYFVINKSSDYERGCLTGGRYQDRRLTVDETKGGHAVFISRLYDSRGPETEWGRFTIDTEPDTNAGLQIGFYSAERPDILHEGRRVAIQELISDPYTSPETKKEVFRPLLKKHFVGHRDVLLNGVRGRYLFFIMELFRQEREISCGDMCLYFPKDSWLKYLPGVYAHDAKSADFTERFLGIFQSLYEDREREIRSSAELLNPSACGRVLLEELAAWHDLKDIYLWSDEKLRELIYRVPRLNQLRGTLSGLKEYLTLYTGTEPVITETASSGHRLICVTVPDRYLRDMREYRSLRRVIGHMIPAGLEVNVVALPSTDASSGVFVMGVNSILRSTDEAAGTDREGGEAKT